MADQQSTALVAVPPEVVQQQSRVVRQAEGLVIEDLESYEASTAFLKLLDDAVTLAGNLFDGNIQRWHVGHKLAVAQKKDFVGPFERAMQIAKYKRIEFRSKAERDRQQKERELREQAETQQKAELEAQAKTLEAAGDQQAAVAVREFAEQAPAPIIVVPKTIPSGGGTVVRKYWRFRIFNADLIPRQFLIPDEKAIGAHGRSLGEKASIAGIEFFVSESEGVL